MRLGGTLQEIDCLADVLQRLLDRLDSGITLPCMCRYSTKAMIQNLGRRTKLFALISRQTRAVDAQFFGERRLRLFAARALQTSSLHHLPTGRRRHGQRNANHRALTGFRQQTG